MYQRGGLKRVIAALGAHARGGDAPEFRIESLDQPARRCLVAIAKARHQAQLRCRVEATGEMINLKPILTCAKINLPLSDTICPAPLAHYPVSRDFREGYRNARAEVVHVWVASLGFAAVHRLMGRQLRWPPRTGHRSGKEKTLYIWAGDQAHKAPDFLAVIDFDEESADYGKVIKTVPLPPPGNVGNEAHHCHLNSTGKLLGCGGLLSVLKGPERNLFLRRQRCQKSAIPVFVQGRGICHHGRLSSHRRRRLPDYPNGIGHRRRPRPDRGIRRAIALCGQSFRRRSRCFRNSRRLRRWTDSTRMESPPGRI